MMVSIEELQKLNYEDGKQLLLANGYAEMDPGREEEAPSCDYILDNYFTLYGEEDEDGNVEELHNVSYSEYRNRNDDPQNDDGSDDFVVKEGWEEV